MDKQQMLTKIYEIIADKTLSPWCRILRKKYREVNWVKGAEPREGFIGQRFVSQKTVGFGVFYSDTWTYAVTEFADYILNDRFDDWELKFEIIWHPVMIGDVLDWIEKNKMEWANRDHLEEEKYEFWDMLNYLCAMRWTKNQPIDNQSGDCIKYVYDLLPPQS